MPGNSTNLPQKDDRGFEIDFELPAGENSTSKAGAKLTINGELHSNLYQHQCKFQDTHFVVGVSHLDHPISYGVEQFYSTQLSGKECYICELLFLFLSFT